MRSPPRLGHRSPALLLVCVLCAGTALALLGVAATLSDAGAGVPPPTSDLALAVVVRFYEAANDVLQSGDVTAIEAIVVPGFIDHAPAPGLAPGRDGLVQVLVSRHATFPGERLVVDHAFANGDEVAIRVHAEGAGQGTFLGLPLPADAGDWGPLEVFRVEGGAIAERWAGAASPLLAQPFWQMPFPTITDDSASVAIGLERRTYAPGEERVVGADPAARIVFVEAGSLIVAGEAANLAGGGHPIPHPMLLTSAGTAEAGSRPALADSHRQVELVTGEAIAIPATGRLAIRNDGDVTATTVAVVLAPSARSAGGGPVTSKTGIVVPPDAVMATGRLVLGSEMTYAFPASAGVILAVVEEGRLEVATPGDSWGPVPTGSMVTAEPGEGGRWRAANGGPVVLLVVTIDQAGAAEVFPQTG